MFLAYLRQGDFVGADMARKFLQMGFTRARRYTNYKGGRKYDPDDQAATREGDGRPREGGVGPHLLRGLAKGGGEARVRQAEGRVEEDVWLTHSTEVQLRVRLRKDPTGLVCYGMGEGTPDTPGAVGFWS